MADSLAAAVAWLWHDCDRQCKPTKQSLSLLADLLCVRVTYCAVWLGGAHAREQNLGPALLVE